MRSILSVKCLYFVLLLYFIQESYGFSLIDSLPNGSLHRIRRQTECSRGQFQCNDKKCIPKWSKCDGVPDCSDSSDETAELCRTQKCPKGFRCQYGACIDIKLKCDGKKDCVDNSDENNPDCYNTATPRPAQGNCKSSAFTCDNKECIAKYKVCDGLGDCTDGSDETSKLCSTKQCTAFRCKYGACVDTKARCNGVQDCVDGSDEDPVLCGYVTQPITTEKPIYRPATGKECVVPERPIYGSISITSHTGENNNPIPGTAVPVLSAIQYKCHAQHKLNVQTHSFACLGGQWQFPKDIIPDCVATCAPRVSNTVDIFCFYHGNPIDCSKRMLEGSTIQMRCKPYHKLLDFSNTLSPEDTCSGGTWGGPNLPCAPDCGKIEKKANALCRNCQDTDIGNHPWHVGVYRKEPGKRITHVCGASLINPKVVVSAAHCFSNIKTGKLHPTDEFYFAAQKNYREYEDDRDPNAQKARAAKILIPDEYRGFTLSFGHDVALAVLDKPFILNNYVTSVCLDSLHDNYVPLAGDRGKVAGWGYVEAEGGLGDPLLKQLQVPVVDQDECEKTVPTAFQSFLTFDKFCAGYNNGSSVCQGDSGGGFVIRDPDTDRYFVRGVVSTSPVVGQWCDNYQVTAYTNLAKHLRFLKKANDYYKT